MLVYQTVGGTFPSLSQTGEGFLLQFDKPRLTLSAEEEWLRACVPMRHQGKARRACVDRSRRARAPDVLVAPSHGTREVNKNMFNQF